MPIKQYVDLWVDSEQYLVHLPIFIEGGFKWNCKSDMCKTEIVSR